jgi:hypothetical protein
MRPTRRNAPITGLVDLVLAPFARLLPFAACTASIGLLSSGLHSPQPVAACFAAAALVVAMVRTAVSVYELRRPAETRRLASTDELTGLPNRRWSDRELRRGSTTRAWRTTRSRCS